MFFDKQYSPETIGKQSIPELEKELNINERPYPISSYENRWAYFSYLKGLENGLSEMYAINFGYTISSFIAGMGVDAGTDIYFKLEIDDPIFNIYENSRNNTNNEEDCIRHFFKQLLDWYLSPDGACKYEKATFHHNIRVGSKTKTWFLSRKQSSKKTITQLMNKTSDSPHINDNEKDENITFKFTYSEEEMWNKIEGNDVEKLASLLR